MSNRFLYEVRVSAWKAFWQALKTLHTGTGAPLTKISFGARNTLYVVDPLTSMRHRIGDKT